MEVLPTRVEQYKTERNKGRSYQEIANEYGVTRQAIHSAIKKNAKSNGWFREESINKVIYPGIRAWMLENRCSIAQLEKRCGVCLRKGLQDGGFTKRGIDAILAVTGLKYESAFK